jgi:sugar phosphate isomerase/epimerase
MKPIAIQLYSLRDSMAEDVDSTLKTVKALGYDGVEFAGLYGRSPEEMKKAVTELGLVPVSAHISLFELINNGEQLINDYKAIGCKHIVIPWLGEAERPGGSNYAETLNEIKRIGGLAREAGMLLSYHNHEFEFVKLESGELGFDNLYASTDAETLKMQLDTCWVSVAGYRPEEFLQKYANRCPLLHLKDYVGSKSKNMYELIGLDEGEKEAPKAFEFRPVGHGVQNFESIIEAAEKCGVEWLIVEQDQPTAGKTPLECAEMSINYLRSL